MNKTNIVEVNGTSTDLRHFWSIKNSWIRVRKTIDYSIVCSYFLKKFKWWIFKFSRILNCRYLKENTKKFAKIKKKIEKLKIHQNLFLDLLQFITKLY